MERMWIPLAVNAAPPRLAAPTRGGIRLLDLRHRPVRAGTRWLRNHLPLLGAAAGWFRIRRASLYSPAGCHTVCPAPGTRYPYLETEAGLDRLAWRHGPGQRPSRLHLIHGRAGDRRIPGCAL